MNKAMDYVLAQVNIGRLLAPLDSAQLATALRAFEDDASGADGRRDLGQLDILPGLKLRAGDSNYAGGSVG